MTIDILLANFDRLAEAPNGIPKLRELILQLAVRGKLVPQDPNDESASELLKRIKAEKERLTAEGKMRKLKPLTPIELREPSQDLPVGWAWVRLAEVGAINPRNNATDDEIAGFVPMRLVFDTFGSYPQWKTRRWAEIKKGYTHFADGDVVLAKITPCFENGKSGVMRGLPNRFGAGTTELHVIRPIPGCIVPEYIWIFFKSPEFKVSGEAQMTGTAGQKRVPKAYVESSLLPLPPFPEQKRIVAKVDELMALCDALEAKQQAKRTKQIALNRASLHALTQSNGTSIATAWYRVRDHFNDLYTVPETVAELRQTILQLAVMGRLVPQDPNDEPASELLKKIQAEKERLIAEGKIRKPKPLPLIDLNEYPIQLPNGWTVTRMAEVFRFIDYRGKTPTKTSGGVRLITAKNVRNGLIRDDPAEYITEQEYERWMTRGFPRKGDILFTTEAPLGLAAVIDAELRIALAQRIIDLQPFSSLDTRYGMYTIQSPLFQGLLLERATGTTAKGIKAAKLKLIPLPIPPLAEQQRIAGKVDQLMTLCDDLDAKLQQAQADADSLLAAIVHEIQQASESSVS